MSDETKWVTAREAAVMLGVTPARIYHLIDDGTLPTEEGDDGIKVIERSVVDHYVHLRGELKDLRQRMKHPADALQA